MIANNPYFKDLNQPAFRGFLLVEKGMQVGMGCEFPPKGAKTVITEMTF